MCVIHRFLLSLIILTGSFLYSAEANAQILKFKGAPISIFQRMPKYIGLSLEHPFIDKTSIALEVTSYVLKNNHSGDGDYSGIMARASLRTYLNDFDDKTNPFLSTAVVYLNTSIPSPDEPLYIIEKGKRKAVGLGLTIGIQRKLSQKICAEFGFGYFLYYESTSSRKTIAPNIPQVQTRSTRLRGEPQFSVAIGWIIKKSSFIQ